MSNRAYSPEGFLCRRRYDLTLKDDQTDRLEVLRVQLKNENGRVSFAEPYQPEPLSAEPRIASQYRALLISSHARRIFSSDELIFIDVGNDEFEGKSFWFHLVFVRDPHEKLEECSDSNRMLKKGECFIFLEENWYLSYNWFILDI